jgi:hypothetical protein
MVEQWMCIRARVPDASVAPKDIFIINAGAGLLYVRFSGPSTAIDVVLKDSFWHSRAKAVPLLVDHSLIELLGAE